jgi:glucosyl-3-phosphoglycerate synthase
VPGDAFTFGVIGRNEAARLHVALGQARAAAGPRDRVWFVDSGSTDDSIARATDLGAEIVKGPPGKGAAIAAARAECDTPYICFVDGDLIASTVNLFAALRDGVYATGADLVVGRYTEKKRPWAITPSIYFPLVTALFAPELAATPIAVPLSGLRAWRTDLAVGELPRGYGIETHLNLECAVRAHTVADWDLGEFVGPLRDYTNLPGMAADVGAAILDCAEAYGRIAPAARPAFDEWVAVVVDLIRTMPTAGPDLSAFRAELVATAARPLPATGVGPRTGR